METQLNQLNHIQKVEAPDALFNKVLQKIATANATVSPRWIAAAAAAIFLLISIDLAVCFTKSNTTKSSISALVPTANNQLYYD